MVCGNALVMLWRRSGDARALYRRSVHALSMLRRLATLWQRWLCSDARATRLHSAACSEALQSLTRFPFILIDRFRTLARDRRTLKGVHAFGLLRVNALVFAWTLPGLCRTLPGLCMTLPMNC